MTHAIMLPPLLPDILSSSDRWFRDKTVIELEVRRRRSDSLCAIESEVGRTCAFLVFPTGCKKKKTERKERKEK